MEELIVLVLLCCACAKMHKTEPYDSPKYGEGVKAEEMDRYDFHNSGKLKHVIVAQPAKVNADCAKTVLAKDNGLPLGINEIWEACTRDSDTVEVSPLASMMMLLHELCHIDSWFSPDDCDKKMSPHKYDNWPNAAPEK